MLFKATFWPGLADGSTTLAFRRWKRPTVKAGGTLRTAAGMLAIDQVEVVEVDDIDEADAVAAGYPALADLLDALGPPAPDRLLYRVAFHRAGPDPREALQADDDLGDGDLAALRALDRLDRAAPTPWTWATLRLLAEHPEVVSRELARLLGQERDVFKANVRKLKALGLTESLDVGYRLSPRGRAVLDAGA